MKTKLFFIAAVTVAFICNQQKANAQANQTLSNLTSPISVNQSLVPATDNILNIGSSSKSWKDLYFKGAIYRGSDLFISSPNVSSTYIGNKAGFSNTLGFANTGVGDSALYSNTEGLYNTATGYLALRYNLKADYNTANGSYALSKNVSGDYNTAVGSQSLNQNNSGRFNTATGYISLYNNSDGQSNTATGFAALELNKSGSFNTAYGYYSLHSNIDGLYNTAIGDSADVTSGNLTNATAIGAYAKVSQSNSLVLGGTGAYGVNVGIGLTNPTAPGPGARSVEVSASNFPQYILQSTNAPANNKLWRTIARNNNIFQIQTLDDNYGTEQTALQVNRNDNSISTVAFPNGNIGIGTTTPSNKLSIAGTNVAIQVNSGLIQTPGSTRDLNITAGRGQVSTGFTSGNLCLQIDGTDAGGALFAGNVGIGTTSPLQKLHVAGASILANNTTINPSTTANTVIAGAIKDGSGWSVTSGVGGKASGAGQAWGIGSIGSSLYFGFSNGTTDNTMQTGIQITGSRNVLLAPGGSGNVGIGTTSPTYKLSVNGTIQAKEILVQTGWSDYVFNKDYKLRSLNEVESYISQNKHLPDVPSATEVENKGVQVAQMDSILIKKVEELTLYIIDQNKQIQQLQQKVVQLANTDADKKN